MRAMLTKLQRKALLMMCSPMRGTPTAGMEVALGVPPLHLWLWETATNAKSRLGVQTSDPILNEITCRQETDHLRGTQRLQNSKDPMAQGQYTTHYLVYTDGSQMRGTTGCAWLFTKAGKHIGSNSPGSEDTRITREMKPLTCSLKPPRRKRLRDRNT